MPNYINPFAAGITGLSEGIQTGMGFALARQRMKMEQMQQEQAMQQIELQKRAADRQDLLGTLQGIETARKTGGKLGDLMATKFLTRLGFPEDEVRAIQKEDDNAFETTWKPAVQYILDQNPDLGLSGAATMLKQMTPEQRLGLLEKSRSAAYEKELQKAQGQIGQQDVTGQPGMMPQQPGMPQAPQATPQANALDTRINFLQQRDTALQDQWNRINSANVPQAAKKSYLDAIRQEMDKNNAQITQAISLKNNALSEQRMAQSDQRAQDAQARFESSQAGIERRFQQAQANQGAALIQARNEAKQNEPLDVAATRWIDPQTLQTASPDMSPAEAKKAGFAVITPSLSQAIPSARTALKTLDRYKELANKLLVDTSKMSGAEAVGAIQLNRAKLKALELKGDPEVAEFIALGATLPSQVKAFGDTGNIAVKETEFAGKSLPNFSDSRQGAQRKIESRTGLLKQVIRSSISTASRKAQVQQQRATQTELKTADDYLKKFNQ